MFKTHPISTCALVVTMALFMLSCGSNVGENAIMNPGGDSDPDNQRVPAKDQEILFDVTYTNFAWGYRLSGFYIDRRGDVYSFSRGPDDERWQPHDWDHISEQDLRDKYSINKDRLGTIDRGTLTSMVDMVGQASVGEMTDRVNRCNDFGGRTWAAYVQDPNTGEYEKIRLYQSGDWAQRNKSSAAATLFEWLRDVAGESGDIVCGCEE